jgi:hypothetical protein
MALVLLAVVEHGGRRHWRAEPTSTGRTRCGRLIARLAGPDDRGLPLPEMQPRPVEAL